MTAASAPNPSVVHVKGAPLVGPQLVLLAGFLASAGLPLYIHLPRFATETGLSLAVMGAVLLAFRLIDLFQDPLLGLAADHLQAQQKHLAGLSILGTGVGFFIVFTLQPALPGLIAGLFVLFTGFSMGTILFYGQCVARAKAAGDAAHYKLAGRREMGTLAGIVLAALLPTGLGTFFGVQTGYAMFGMIMALASVALWWICRSFWTGSARAIEARPTLRDFRKAGAAGLLGIALLNALPVAITSSLFLFFVEDRLGLPDLAGLYLVLFFAAAGASAPIWTRLATRFGPRPVLLVGMSMAILSFVFTAALPAGSAWGFAAITVVSGAALGADMVILPAMFSSLLARADLPAGIGFGAWFFASKLALALAAATVLPLLQVVGYVPGGPNAPEALTTLNAAYAILPCILKLPALVLVARLNLTQLPKQRA
ncbi:MFS transporter [Phaeobacter marinintestinus]|uniref:MFS transporter n=1 Tax=Falsiphaeobacter marinintestinus TaxID=1492905 RepID=UPI0011B43460|nr:MFS transporter [Phaeobacter marinintestinus]